MERKKSLKDLFRKKDCGCGIEIVPEKKEEEKNEEVKEKE